MFNPKVKAISKTTTCFELSKDEDIKKAPKRSLIF